MLPILTAVLFIAVANGEIHVIMTKDLLSKYETQKSQSRLQMDLNTHPSIVEGKNWKPGKTRISFFVLKFSSFILQATCSQKLCISSAQID